MEFDILFFVKRTTGEIKYAFNGRLMGKSFMKMMVCETVLRLPSDLIKYITANIWFISSPDDAWSFTFRGTDIKDQYLVILSDELLKQDEEQIQFSILHEIGHAILGHKNSIGRKQSKLEIKQQEAEADQFAGKYL